MKIAFVYDVIYPYVKGGVEKRVWELAVRLSRKGHNVHLFGMKFWEGEDTVIREGITLHGVCPAQKLYTGGRRSIWQAFHFSIYLIFPLFREKFDIIDCQQFPLFPCFTSKIVSLIKKTPLVITWYEVWGDYWLEYLGYPGLLGKVIERDIATFNCATITVSATTASRFKTCFKKPVTTVIPVGIDISYIRSIPPSLEQSDIIFAGRLIKEKNVILLVRAFHSLSRQHPHIKLTIIGSGPEREKISALIHNLSLEDLVSLRGFADEHDDLIALLKSSKVFVLPSSREGFGISALEALACGLPVVTVNHPANAIRDLITVNNGFQCSLSAKDLAASIWMALQNHEEMRNSCILSAGLFDWEHITLDIEAFYHTVIAG
ncbi:MAG: glycosyltransferase family 4 protein [Methanoregula sp.]|jgi:glycosyltransferase involved in cell wall biosynthesis